MTKKTLTKIIALTILAIPMLSVLVPHVANANIITDGIASGFFTLTATISEFIFTVAGWFISLCGVLLNGVMMASLNMKSIVDNTPAIGVAWRTIRDFSSIFIIFMLLFASIKMILGAKDHDLGSLIKNIIIAGLLINFSLFGTKLLIDASNIVSCSFYTAMAPNSGTCSANSKGISDAFSSTGLSNIFMQSLNIQGAVPTANTLKQNANTELSITFAYIGGSILMVVAGMSFIVAAIMFAIRIGVLILLMAFSPIYFIAMIMPQVAPYAKKWSGALYSMCIFMPVYLFLMYIAVSIINDPGFFNFAKLSDTQNAGLLSAHTVGVFLQYIIAFIMINAPLVAAVSIAGEGADFVNKMTDSVKKWGQGAIKGTSNYAWRETGGRAADALAKNQTFRNIAGKTVLGELALKGARGVGADYSDITKKKAEEKVKFGESLGHDEVKMAAEQRNLRQIKADIAAEKAAGRTPTALMLRNKNASEGKILDIETARQKEYAARIETAASRIKGKKPLQAGNLFSHLTRGNNIAAAKVQITVEEREMKDKAEDLKEKQADLKSVEKDLKNATDLTVIATLDRDKKKLLGDISNLTAEVSQHKNTIDDLNLKAK